MKLTQDTKKRLIRAMDREAQWYLAKAKRLQRLGAEIETWRENGAASGYQEVRRYLEKAKSITPKGLETLMNRGRENIEYSLSAEDEESKAFSIAKAFAIKDAITILREEARNG